MIIVALVIEDTISQKIGNLQNQLKQKDLIK